jgi:hypothetical protein
VGDGASLAGTRVVRGTKIPNDNGLEAPRWNLEEEGAIYNTTILNERGVFT